MTYEEAKDLIDDIRFIQSFKGTIIIDMVEKQGYKFDWELMKVCEAQALIVVAERFLRKKA